MTDTLLTRPLITIDIPGAGSAYILGANTAGQFVGGYADAAGIRHGFIYDLTTAGVASFDVPGADWTTIYDINAAGDITGWYSRHGTVLGFVRHGGMVETVAPPGATYVDSVRINDAGQIAGSFVAAGSPFVTHTFLLQDGVYQTLDAPGAVSSSFVDLTANGTVLGAYFDGRSTGGVYIYHDGTYSAFGYPGIDLATPKAINAAGQVAGLIAFPDRGPGIGFYSGFVYSDGVASYRGFLQTQAGLVCVLIDGPGTVIVNNVRISSIGGVMADGTVFGSYLTVENGIQREHPYIGALPASGGATLASGATYDLSPGPLSLGQARLGDAAAMALRLNNLSAPGSGHVLGATLDVSAGLTAAGAISGLAPGGMDIGTLRVGLDTGSVGVKSGSVAVTLTDAAGGPPGTAQIAAFGTVYSAATLALAATTIDLGTRHVGAFGGSIAVANAAPAGSFSEGLTLALSASGTATLSGGLARLAAGAAADLGFLLDPGTSGTFDVAATLAATSDGAGIDALAPLALGDTALHLIGTAVNYAVAQPVLLGGPFTLTGSGTAYVLDLGTLTLNSGPVSARLGLRNAAAGLADPLGGAFSFTAAPGFANPADTTASGIAAGDVHALSEALAFTPGTPGIHGETFTIAPTGDFNGTGYPLGTITVTVHALVVGRPQADTIHGTPLPDLLAGEGGADLITGYPQDGDGTQDSDTLQGGDGRDTLLGGRGDDSLDGGSGADRMEGGAGDDSYIINIAQDTVIEAPDAGNDTVFLLAGFYALPENVENLTLGTTATSGWGNALDNALTGNTVANELRAGAGNDTVLGGGGDDRLVGGTGSDSLAGGAGNDTLDEPGAGATGADTLAGRAGADTYFVDNAGDAVIEAPGGGSDTIVSLLRFTALPANVESLIMQTTAPATGWGNAASNRIVGGQGADTLRGGMGNDTLEGGPGADLLHGGGDADVFVLRAGDAQGDRIDDFMPGVDQLRLEGFGLPANGASFTPLSAVTWQITPAGGGPATLLRLNPVIPLPGDVHFF